MIKHFWSINRNTSKETAVILTVHQNRNAYYVTKHIYIPHEAAFYAN